MAKKNKSKSSPVKFIVLVVIIGFFAIFAWSWYKDYSKDRFSEKDITSWKTYINSEAGYSLEVPIDWHADQTEVYNSIAAKYTVRQPKDGFLLKIYPGSPTATFPADTPESNIDGVIAKKTYRTDWNTGISSLYFKEKNNLLISASYNISQKDKYQKDFDLIMSTFKFIPEETAPSRFGQNSSADLTVQNFWPTYVNYDYLQTDEKNMTIRGTGFLPGVSVALEGPYLPPDLTPDARYFRDYWSDSVTLKSDRLITGILPPGLPPGFFKVIIKNKDGSTDTTGYMLLRGPDPSNPR